MMTFILFLQRLGVQVIRVATRFQWQIRKRVGESQRAFPASFAPCRNHMIIGYWLHCSFEPFKRRYFIFPDHDNCCMVNTLQQEWRDYIYAYLHPSACRSKRIPQAPMTPHGRHSHSFIYIPLPRALPRHFK